MLTPFPRLISFAALAAVSSALASAQVVIAPTTPQVGSSNPVTAEPLVKRPTTKPCIVPLFNNLEFANYTPKVFNYTPPSSCSGPWSKVVFTADFTVTSGIQFDRTAAFYIGHANIYYGTTNEPTSTLSPDWHVERDVTDLSYILQSAQTGEANLGNFVGVYNGTDYNGLIYANAALEFYPADFRNPAPRVPDIVVPVNGSGGDAGTLNTTTDTISQTLNLPENVEAVYLDVISQPQSNDEFYYFNVPNDETGNLLSYGGTAFRETEIWIDGNPAGVAPVYPFINTGGFDPNLWFPIVGNQTHAFKPFRVNLTPFAGLLSDGNQHTVAVSVYNADSYFLETANLLVYQDRWSKKITGGVLENTLTEPTPVLTNNITYNSTTNQYTGTITDNSEHSFVIKGYVNTSHGRVETTLAQKITSTNSQQFDVDPVPQIPDIQSGQQNATLDSVVTTREGFFTYTSEQHYAYPLTVSFAYAPLSGGGVYENVSVDQTYKFNSVGGPFGFPLAETNIFEETKSQDDQQVNAAGTYTDASKSSQTYRSTDAWGNCYSETLTAANNVLTGVTNNGCKQGW